MAEKQAVTRPIPDSFEAMYPGRFMKAVGFKGKKLLFKIKAIFGEDLLSSEDEDTKQEWVTQFEDCRLDWVMNKTNAYCLFRMFGGDPHTWVGKRIVLYGQPGVWFGEKGEAIRVYGSPDIAEDLPITLRFLRKKKDRNMVMKRTSDPNAKAMAIPDASTPTQPQGDTIIHPRLIEIFGLLGWNADVRVKWLKANEALSDEDKIAKLSKEL